MIKTISYLAGAAAGLLAVFVACFGTDLPLQVRFPLSCFGCFLIVCAIMGPIEDAFDQQEPLS